MAQPWFSGGVDSWLSRGVDMDNSVAEHYGAQFFKEQSAGSFESASVIVPLVLRLFKVNSVVDVGCGVGAWLHDSLRTV
jgi:hypothetical protein